MWEAFRAGYCKKAQVRDNFALVKQICFENDLIIDRANVISVQCFIAYLFTLPANLATRLAVMAEAIWPMQNTVSRLTLDKRRCSYITTGVNGLCQRYIECYQASCYKIKHICAATL